MSRRADEPAGSSVHDGNLFRRCLACASGMDCTAHASQDLLARQLPGETVPDVDPGLGSLFVDNLLDKGSDEEGPAGDPTSATAEEAKSGQPLPLALASTFTSRLGHDVSDVRVQVDGNATSRLGARAFSSGRQLIFAPGQYRPDTRSGQHLIAHELAHVVQVARGREGIQASHGFEREAELAADLAMEGRSAGPLSGFGADGPLCAPDRPDTVTAPFVSTILPLSRQAGTPAQLEVRVKMSTPGFGAEPGVSETMVFHRPVLGGTTVSVYAIRLEDLYATADDARLARSKPKKDRKGLSLWGALNFPSPAPATPPAPTPAPAAPVPPTAAAPGAATTPGTIVNAGPSPTDTLITAFDLQGHPVGLVARNADVGITTEYQLFSVGAASCTVLLTPTGVSLIDAGVRHDGKTVDPDMIEYAMKRLKEVIGDRPIEELPLTHAHTDHIALVEAISREFVIKQISINSIQLNDKTFLEQVENLADNQRQVHHDQLEKKYRAQREIWDKDPELNQESEAGAQDAAFDRWVAEKVAVDLAEVPPVKVNLLAPTGSVVDASAVELGKLDIVRRDANAPAGPDEGFVYTEYARSTLLDPKFQERQEKMLAAKAKDPDYNWEASDTMSSNIIMRLPNGNQLVIIPDIRVGDIARFLGSLKTELRRLGADVEFRVWQMTHHAQSGFAGSRKGAKDGAPDGDVAELEPAKVEGVGRLSQLVKLTELLHEITRTPGKGGAKPVDIVMVSVDMNKVDPAVVKIIRSCGLQVLTARDKVDLSFIEAVSATGRKVAGITGGEHPGQQSDEFLLKETSLALEYLNTQLDDAAAKLQANKKDVIAETARLKKAHDALMKQRRSLSDAMKNAQRAAGPDAGPRQASKPLAERQAALEDARKAVEENEAALAELDQPVTDLKASGKALEAEIARLRTQIKSIKEGRNAYLDRIDTDIGKSRLETNRPSIPEEGPPPAEEGILRERVRPIYKLASDEMSTAPRLAETSLIILGKAAQTEEGKKLESDRAEIEALLDRIEHGDRPLEAHAELLDKLGAHIKELESRPDAADPLVADQIAYYQTQFIASQDTIKAAADKGERQVDRDPSTGRLIESKIIVETTPEQAAEQDGTEPSAEPVPAADPRAPLRARMEKGMKWFGRGMGAVMIYQNVTGGLQSLVDDAAGNATTPQMLIGTAKTVYGINIGWRMLAGKNVGVAEFAMLSVLDIAETASNSYASTGEYDTEVTYSVIRNSVNLALATLGGEIISAGLATAQPEVVLVGLVVMFVGDSILDALGVHEWLAKKFDWRPDEYIDLEKDLAKLLEQYSLIAGGLKLKGRTDESLTSINAQDPSAVRAATDYLTMQKMALVMQEHQILCEFEDAYDRAREGYAELREIDELRARFMGLFVQVHADDLCPTEDEDGDGIPDLPDTAAPAENGDEYWEVAGPPTIDDVKARFATIEDKLSATLSPISEDEVPKMEQWDKMTQWSNTLQGDLYRTNYEDIDWMEVAEAQEHLTAMLNNARYRLDPGAQGEHRKTPLFPEGSPARRAYVERLHQVELEFDVLRKRAIDVANRNEPTGIRPPGPEGYADANDIYYQPQWETWMIPSLWDQMALAEGSITAYRAQVDGVAGLPGDLTPEGLYSDTDVLARYPTVALYDSRYKSDLFRLKASEMALVGLVQRVGESSATWSYLAEPTVARLRKLARDLREVTRYRSVEKGYLFFEEMPAKMNRIESSRVTKLAALFGEDASVTPLDPDESAAAQSDQLEAFDLGTLSQRVAALGVELPSDPESQVMGVYMLLSAPNVLVASKHRMFAGEQDFPSEPTFKAIPLNAAAIAYFGGTGEVDVHPYDAYAVQLKDLQEKMKEGL